jgi:hypothetical protein
MKTVFLQYSMLHPGIGRLLKSRRGNRTGEMGGENGTAKFQNWEKINQ